MRVAALLFAIFAVCANAAPTDCEKHYADGDAPEITRASITIKAQELCYSEIGVMFSGVSRTPLWSAEHLTRAHLDARHKFDVARGVNRRCSFKPEIRLPLAERVADADYSVQGKDPYYQKGHMAPDHDMSNGASERESCTYSNAVPQVGAINEHLWSYIEAAVRDSVTRDSDVYVITGPIFRGKAKKLNGRVAIPQEVFKAVYYPKKGIAGAYVVTNSKDNTDEYTSVSISALEKSIGIILFPSLSDDIKAAGMTLPEPAGATLK